MLQAALALSSGSALSLLQEQEQSADDFGKLIEQAGLGEPALRTYPTTKQMKLCEAAAKCNKPLPYSCTVEGLEDSRAWVEGRTFAEWTSSFIKFAWAGLLHGRLNVASVLNHLDKVATLAADTKIPTAQAENMPWLTTISSVATLGKQP